MLSSQEKIELKQKIKSNQHVADYFLTDNATLSQLIGTLATDVVKVGLATGASIVAASALVGFGVTLDYWPHYSRGCSGLAGFYGAG